MYVPHFRLVSWDFSVSEAGEPVLIESNLRYGELDFHQLINGPVFGDDTKKIWEKYSVSIRNFQHKQLLAVEEISWKK